MLETRETASSIKCCYVSLPVRRERLQLRLNKYQIALAASDCSHGIICFDFEIRPPVFWAPFVFWPCVRRGADGQVEMQFRAIYLVIFENLKSCSLKVLDHFCSLLGMCLQINFSLSCLLPDQLLCKWCILGNLKSF